MWNDATLKNTEEYINEYERNMNEHLTEYISSSNNLHLYSAVINKNKSDYYIKIDRYTPFINGAVNQEYRVIKVNIYNPSYDISSDDIFTKEEKDIFIDMISNNWQTIIYNTKSLYVDWLKEELPLELPDNIPDYSLLPTKD